MRTFVVLFAGGIDANNNYPRYSADLTLLLTAFAGYPGLDATSITVLAGDGGGAFQFGNVPVASVVAADRNGLQNALNGVAVQATAGDRFFFFSSNHGGQTTPGQSSSTLYCWCGGAPAPDQILPVELANMSAAIQCGVQIFVHGQCYSGGFIAALQSPNRAILTACNWDEVSYASAAMSGTYDEFLYRIAEGLEARIATISDLFSYAKRNDLEKESPQFDGGAIGAISVW